MSVSYFEVKKVFDTLPVGYYIGRDVKRELSESKDGSYYDPMNDKIIISFPFIKEGLDKSETTDIENDTRTLLYHEVSHAFLTPKKLMETFRRYATRQGYNELTIGISFNSIINIFEDERIERIFDNYFYGVNFRKYCERVNDWKGISHPSNIQEAWFDFIRFRATTKRCEELLPRIDEIIKINKTLTNWSSDLNSIDYCSRVWKLFINFFRKWKEEDKTNKEKNESDTTLESRKTKKADNSSSENKEKTSSKKDESEISNNSDEENPIISSKELQKIIKNISEQYIDKNIIETFMLLFNKNSKVTKKNSAAINAYSGVFDPRSTIRDDYKFFLQSNRVGHQKAFSKMKLNLFIDRSGSFANSVPMVNKIIYALQKIEKVNPDFEFDVVTIGMDERLLPKNNRTFDAAGGNAITPALRKIYNSLQNSKYQTINILLFDGNCYTDCDFEDCESLSVFNNKKSVVISEASNEHVFNKFIPSVKVNYCKNFVNELFKSIITALQIVLG
jgi:hypothetical protein|nr:MAG TPA: cobalamin biosynthesis protein [Caudoviricetes sp.]